MAGSQTRFPLSRVSLRAFTLTLAPFVDRSGERDPRRRRIWMALGIVVLLAWLGLTIYGAVTVPVSHTGMGTPEG
jgi:quinol-cytochrome oxidoreductase complex cytochrome b subunit